MNNDYPINHNNGGEFGTAVGEWICRGLLPFLYKGLVTMVVVTVLGFLFNFGGRFGDLAASILIALFAL